MKPEKVEHAGHTIEVRPGDEAPQLLIDGRPVRWGRFDGDGRYFLHEHAYEPGESLVEAAARYAEHLARREAPAAKAE